MKFVTLLASLVTYDKFYKIKESDSSDEESDDVSVFILDLFILSPQRPRAVCEDSA